MDQVQKNNGVASGLIGLIQYGFGALVGLVISVLPQSIINLPGALVVGGLVAVVFLKMGSLHQR